MIETKYSDSQPRDDHGRWSSGGSSTVTQQAQQAASSFGHLVGAAATATLAATVLAAALRKPQKMALGGFAKTAANAVSSNMHQISRNLMHSSLKRALTESEVKLIRQYTQGESQNLNKKLRTGTVGKFDNPHLIPKLDSLIRQSRLSEDTHLFRGVRGKHVKDWVAGAVVGDAGFGSSSLSKTVGEQFAAKDKDGMVVHILAKKDSHALPVDGHSQFDTEHEVILPRNTTYRITHREGRVIHAELL